MMKAVCYHNYGSYKELQITELNKPKPRSNEVLVKVHAVSLNASDIELLKGSPAYTRIWGLFKPKNTILGSDIAGIVESVGEGVSHFKPGDAVFGDIFESWGGLAEYVCVDEKQLFYKPNEISFEEAAAIPQAALVAYQGLKEKGMVEAGMEVLINGAGGGAGTFAMQIAKHEGALVTGVDSKDKLDLMKSLGVDNGIDYKQEDFTKNGKKYDLIIDFVASHSILDYKRSLNAKGKYVMVGGKLRHLFQTLCWGSVISLLGSKKMVVLGAKPNKRMKEVLELIRSGKIKPIIDSYYSLEESAEAFTYLGEGKAKGKVVISI